MVILYIKLICAKTFSNTESRNTPSSYFYSSVLLIEIREWKNVKQGLQSGLDRHDKLHLVKCVYASKPIDKQLFARNLLHKYKNNCLFFVSQKKSFQREIHLWDVRNTSAPVHESVVDTGNNVLTPLFDQDASVVFLVGKVN